MSPQGSVTFHRLREYVIGDDLRKVHWPSTARLGKLVVRQYVDTAQPYTVVLVDLRPEVYSPDSFEEAIDVAASVVASMSAGEAPVQLRTTTGERVGGTRKSDPTVLVDYLTDLAPSAEGSLFGRAGGPAPGTGGNALVVVTGAAQVDSLARGRGAAPALRPGDRGVARTPGRPRRRSTRGSRSWSATSADELARRGKPRWQDERRQLGHGQSRPGPSWSEAQGTCRRTWAA